MDTEKIIDKLNFYIGFLDVFSKACEGVVDEKNIHNLKMLREYMIEAIKKLREKKKEEEKEMIVSEIYRKNCYNEFWNTPGCKECYSFKKCKEEK